MSRYHWRLALFVLGTMVVCLFGCSRGDKDADKALTKVSLRQEWFPNSNYAGALFAQKNFARPNGIDLNVEAGSDNVDPIKLVISGQDMFGDAGADKVLLANAKGADLVVIGVLNYHSPTCFIAKAEKNIRTPKDFEGRRVGVLTGTSTEYVYRTLVSKQDLDPKKIRELEAPFDLATFVADAYDVRPAFIYDEPVSLDLQHIEYTTIDPFQYGVDFLGTVYFTKRETIENSPAIVQSFVNAVADGWSAAIKYPEQAIELLSAYDPTTDSQRELLSLRKALPYFRGKNDRVLHADYADWEGMLKSLQDLGVVENVDLRAMIDESFLDEYERSLARKNHAAN